MCKYLICKHMCIYCFVIPLKIIFSNCNLSSIYYNLENLQPRICFQKEWTDLNTTKFHCNFMFILTTNLRKMFYISH